MQVNVTDREGGIRDDAHTHLPQRVHTTFDRQPPARLRAYEYPNGKLVLFHRPNISGGMVLREDWAVGKANGGWEGRVNRFDK